MGSKLTQQPSKIESFKEEPVQEITCRNEAADYKRVLVRLSSGLFAHVYASAEKS